MRRIHVRLAVLATYLACGGGGGGGGAAVAATVWRASPSVAVVGQAPWNASAAFEGAAFVAEVGEEREDAAAEALAPNKKKGPRRHASHAGHGGRGDKMLRRRGRGGRSGAKKLRAVEAAEAETQAARRRRVKAHWRALGLLSFVVAAMLPILVTMGTRPFAVAVLYVSSLVLVVVLVKDTITNGFPYPYTITTLHLGVTFIVASLLDRPPPLEESISVLPISIFNGASLLLNNSALVFGTTVFVSMIGTCTPATTFFVEAASNRMVFSASRVLAVFVVCWGAVMCITGELTFSSMALALALSANVCRSIRTVIQHKLLTQQSPYRLVVTSAAWSFLLLLPLCFAVEGLGGVQGLLSAGLRGQLSLAASAVAAVVFNVTQCVALRYLGPLLVNVIGNLQIILVLVAACAWLDEEVSQMQWAGVVMIALGCALTKLSGTPGGPPTKEQAPSSLPKKSFSAEEEPQETQQQRRWDAVDADADAGGGVGGSGAAGGCGGGGAGGADAGAGGPAAAAKATDVGAATTGEAVA